MTVWREFVHIEATHFKAGEHPWTRQDFFEHSAAQAYAPHTVDPIIINMGDEIYPDLRVAENDGWWVEIGDFWDGAADILDECQLSKDVTRFNIRPISTLAGDKEEQPMSMLTWECLQMSVADTFETHIESIKALCDKYRGDNSHISLLTVWACESGQDYDGEYNSNRSLVGYVRLTNKSISIEELEQ
jgi:hypothetical protein